jgi:FMN-dependent oxidoreductase (nitrilotriacetate monooxygenase family)
VSRRKAHLLGFVQHGLINHASSMWAHPRDKVNMAWYEPEYWRDLGRLMERGLFDAMFIADELAPYNTYGGNSDAVVQFAGQCPVHDPAAVVPIIGAFTERLGIGITLSTSFTPPYLMARKLSTLDHLTKGRVGWNIVTSYSRSEFQAMGLDNLTPRDKRYEVVDEYMDICYRLWDSWEPDAIVADAGERVFADPAKVHEVDYEGEYFKCKGRSFVFRSPQHRPVLWQAGASDQGRDFASRHAESVFGIFPTPKTMKSYASDIRGRAERHGRDPGELKLIFGLQTIVDRDRSRALELHEEFKELVRPEAALSILSGHVGYDFSQHDLDDRVEDADVQGIRGQFDAILNAKDGGDVSVREAAEYYGVSLGAPVAAGTPADVADQMEAYLDDGDCNGFMLLATDVPGCFANLVDLVVPELQRRGRYRDRYPGTTLRDSLREY